MALGVILGGRIGYVLFYQFGGSTQNPAYILKVWEGGMSFGGYRRHARYGSCP